MPPRPVRRLRRLLWRCAIAVALCVVIFGIVIYVALSRYALVAPTWWQPPSASDPRTIEAARAVENGVTTVLHQHHTPDQTWTMSLSAADANAWLAARLKEWVANQDGSISWPSELSSCQIDFKEGQIVFGLGVMYRGGERVLSLTVSPRVDEAGALWIPATGFAVGKLSLPASWAVSGSDSVLRSYLPASAVKNEHASKALDALSGKVPISTRPTMKLSDGRRVSVVGIRSEAGKLLVTCKPAGATP